MHHMVPRNRTVDVRKSFFNLLFLGAFEVESKAVEKVGMWLQTGYKYHWIFFSIFFFYVDKVKLGGATLPRSQDASLCELCRTLQVHLTASVEDTAAKV